MRVACILFEKPTSVSKLAERFLRFSPQICIREDMAIFVEIGRCKNLYSEESFINRTKVLLKKLNLAASIKVGCDISDAMAFATFNASSIDALPLGALIYLCDPLCKDLQLQKSIYAMINSFSELDVKTLKDFRKIPLSDLISRFGVVGRFCHQKMTGESKTTWPDWKPEEIISEKKEFTFGFNGDLELIIFDLKSMLDGIFSRLRAREKRLSQLQVNIACEKRSTVLKAKRMLVIDFYAPQILTKGTLKILTERLNKELEKNPIESPIESLELRATKTLNFKGSQKNILNNLDEKLEEINSLHNQLVEILGKENIYQAELTQDRRPEKSWKKKFLSIHQPPETPIKLKGVISKRTTYLCRKPLKIEVTSGFVHIKRRRYKILNFDQNVEVLAGGWFEEPKETRKNTFNRSYRNVILEGNRRIYVFETEDREFFLHGYDG